MAKEILLYKPVNTDSAIEVVNALEDARVEDIVLRINTSGGGPEDMYSIIAKFTEHEGNKIIKVDGKAYSAGAFLLAYSNNVEALDTSKFLIHRASYGQVFEKSPRMTKELWDNLKSINESMREGFEAKVDADKFKEVSGVSLDEVFSLDSRIDVFLNAKQAKEIGLVDRIVKITPEIQSRLEAFHNEEAYEIVKPNSKLNNMKIDQMKADHPELFAQVLALGVSQEQDRVESVMVFAHLDLDKSKEILASGNCLSEKDKAEFSLKAMQVNSLQTMVTESPEAVVTAPVVAENEPTAFSSFQAELDETLKNK
tara:strand:- start:1325 stop:2260 length:936 start_codon:yes stop_codon:yes gene_type:complete